MKLNIIAGITAIVLLLAMSSASATSFIVDCQYDEYRTNTSDIVFTGTVSDIQYQTDNTYITLEVDETEKGTPGQAVTLSQPGNLQTGQNLIPSLSLEWKVGEVYRIQAVEYNELESDESEISLNCGEMGRELISHNEPIAEEAWQCRDMPAIAINPENEERTEFNSECDVPRGWTLVTRTAQPEITCGSAPVVAINDNGVRQEFNSDCEVPRGWAILHRAQNGGEMCIQVITYAQNPETGDIQEYPTPCDVPQGWEVVDEPQEVTHEEQPKRSFWQRIGNWFRSIF